MAEIVRLMDLQRTALFKSLDGGVTWVPETTPGGGGGGGGGTQYAEGATAATITGTAAMWEDTGDTLRAVSAAKPLPVNVVAGATGAVQYVDGVTQASPTGMMTEWLDTSNVVRAVSAAKPLPVGVQGTVPVSGTFWQATQPVSGPLTDTQLRASAVPVSLASVPSHAVTNAGTFAVQADTELPAAAALADATSNPTVPAVGAFGHFYNGTTWDRMRGDTTNGLDVDVTRVSGTVTVNQAQVAGTATDVNSGNKSAGTQRIVIATDQPQLTNALKVDGSAVTQPVSGSVTVVQDKAASATVTQVACSTTSAVLKASNASRKALVIFNDAAQALYVKFGATASTTSFSVKIPAGAVYELPFAGLYTGTVDGIFASGTGNAYVTEV